MAPEAVTMNNGVQRIHTVCTKAIERIITDYKKYTDVNISFIEASRLLGEKSRKIRIPIHEAKVMIEKERRNNGRVKYV